MAEVDDQAPKHPGGRPLKFQTVEDLDLAIQNYFAEQDPHTMSALVETGRDSKGNMIFDTRTVLTEQKPYTMTGLARALGVDRKTLLGHITHDNVGVAAGEQFDCSDDQAKVLVASGVAKAVAEAKPETTAPQTKAPEVKKKAAQAK